MTAMLRGYPVAVGDAIVYRNVDHDRRAHGEITVTKIGPKRLAFERWGRTNYANLETGRIDDWTWVLTLAECVEQEARAELWTRLRSHGLRSDLGGARRIATATLAELVDVLDRAADSA